MQNVYKEVDSLDTRCYNEFQLSQDILMENAANAIASYIRANIKLKSTILIIVGGGNNGADGIALARILHDEYNTKLYLALPIKSKMALIQLNRAKLVGVMMTQNIENSDVIVDAILGSGINRELPTNIIELIDKLNLLNAIKIACDVPTAYRFKADTTITMGAAKWSLYEDYAKDYVGDIIVANLGVSQTVYQMPSNTKLLEFSDMKLPTREIQNSHKGVFGHLSIIGGLRQGAQIISALSATRFGVGLTTIITQNNNNIPYEIMSNTTLPTNTTAIAIGMGLGKEYDKSTLNSTLPMIIDADLFNDINILNILKKENVVLTPHPKEFISMYNMVFNSKISIENLQTNRFKYLQLLANKYPNIVFLLKGANVLIARGDNIYINPYGTNRLSKGGSGDVLSGLIGSLLAQGYTPLEAAITSSLAHTKLATLYSGLDFSMMPNDLIDNIKLLLNSTI